LIALNKVKSECDKKARFRSRILLSLGSSIFFYQFYFIMSGTFLHASWDVMEPISYVMMLGNFTVGMLFYALFHKEMELKSLHQIFSQWLAKGIYRRKGLKMETVEELEREITELKEILNKSIY
jgi:Mitochondrial calcium uniporter